MFLAASAAVSTPLLFIHAKTRSEKKLEKDVEAKTGAIHEELKQAGKFKIPLNDLISIVLEKCPASEKIDALDYLLLRVPVTEVGKVTYASVKAQSSRSSRGGDSDKVRDVETKAYREMKESGASHGAALAHASQQAGMAAYGESLKNWDWTEYNRRKSARDSTAFNKSTRRKTLEFICLYQLGEWNILQGFHTYDVGDSLNPLVVARLFSRFGQNYRPETATWYMQFDLDAVLNEWAQGLATIKTLPLSHEDMSKLLAEGTALALRHPMDSTFQRERGRRFLWALHRVLKELPVASHPKDIADSIKKIAEKAGLEKVNCRSAADHDNIPTCIELQLKLYPGMSHLYQ